MWKISEMDLKVNEKKNSIGSVIHNLQKDVEQIS